MNIIKVRDSFAKGQKGWKGSLTNRREGGLGKYALSSPFLPPAEQGRRAWAPAAVFAGGLGHGDGRDHGEQREGGLWG